MPLVRKALSEGLGLGLEGIMNRPNGPMEIRSEDQLRLLLNMLVPQHIDWGKDGRSRSLDHLITELLERDCRLYVIEWKGAQLILRDIKTATLYVTTERRAPAGSSPSVKKLWLREYHLVNGNRVPRSYNNSMSEKRTLDESSYLHAAIRALRKELSIDPKPEHFMPPYLFSMTEYPDVVGEWTPSTEQSRIEQIGLRDRDIRETPRYPGILTRNQLEHFMWLMPDEYFVPEGYHEPGTNHYFEWQPL